MSRLEVQSFLEFAPHYIQYCMNTIKDKVCSEKLVQFILAKSHKIKLFWAIQVRKIELKFCIVNFSESNLFGSSICSLYNTNYINSMISKRFSILFSSVSKHLIL